jgi:hypothetical protein
VDAGERGAQPSTAGTPGTPGSTSARGSTHRTHKPRLRRAVLTRAPGHRKVLAELVLADAGAVASVRGLLLHHGKVVGKASASVRRPQQVRLRFPSKRKLKRGRYEILLTLIGRDGRVTRVRKHLHVS